MGKSQISARRMLRLSRLGKTNQKSLWSWPSTLYSVQSVAVKWKLLR